MRTTFRTRGLATFLARVSLDSTGDAAGLKATICSDVETSPTAPERIVPVKVREPWEFVERFRSSQVINSDEGQRLISTSRTQDSRIDWHRPITAAGTSQYMPPPLPTISEIPLTADMNCTVQAHVKARR